MGLTLKLIAAKAGTVNSVKPKQILISKNNLWK
jgi:hypothetical protein